MQTDNRYRPNLNDSDCYKESPEQYCSRMHVLLPNFPSEVLIQWFYRHWIHIDEYAWLEYKSLAFQKVLWTANEVISSGIKEKHTVQIDHQHYETGLRYSRQESIIAHFESTGTWPIPPIFLKNICAKISFPDGRQCTKPYHLIEGHHRAAIFWSYYDRSKVKSQHHVWMVNIKGT